MPTSYHLSIFAVHAAAQPGQLHTAASAARAADQDWRRISGSYAGAAAPQADSSQTSDSGASVPDFTFCNGHPEQVLAGQTKSMLQP